MELETRRVVRKSDGLACIINADDFDPDVHADLTGATAPDGREVVKMEAVVESEKAGRELVGEIISEVAKAIGVESDEPEDVVQADTRKAPKAGKQKVAS